MTRPVPLDKMVTVHNSLTYIPSPQTGKEIHPLTVILNDVFFVFPGGRHVSSKYTTSPPRLSQTGTLFWSTK